MTTSQLIAASDAALHKLEFFQVLERLAGHCQFEPTLALAAELRPSNVDWKVERELERTAEAVEIVSRFPDISVGGAHDLTDIVDRAAKGSRLQADELTRASATLHVSALISRAIHRARGGEIALPHFDELATGLVDLPHLETAINHAIGPDGEVLDSASEELARIRREIRLSHNRLMERLNRIISGDRYGGALQDSIVTTRDGRYVVPVRSDSRAKVPGVVHDTSASGQTLFMEPMEIVDLNNRWREARSAEQHEIDRILLALSQNLGAEAEDIHVALATLAEIDLLLAKAKYSFSLRASRPQLRRVTTPNGDHVRDTRIKLIRAKHPLMDPKTTVAIDIEVGFDFRALLITGPNTGGKTVTLKTVGLLAAMAQSGLFITADDQSQTSVFDGIYVDIGDEQSIAQSLSTFSGHMTNVIQILAQAGPESLVLIDEIGSGTDPQEGSAIARAVVTEFLATGPLLLATTHYSDVKAFAFETASVENASVEFDVQTLSPTYRLLIGVPGQSNALTIAGSLGLPQPVLERAQSYLDPEELRSDRLLQDIQERRRAVEREMDRVNQEKEEIEKLKRAAEESLAEAELERRMAYDAALIEAEALMSETRRLARQTDRQLRSDGNVLKREVPMPDLLGQAAESVSAVQELAKKRGVVRRREELVVGDRVRIRSLDQEGVLTHLGLDDADVQMGQLRITRPVSDLVRLGAATPQESSRPRFKTAPVQVPMELDLRGFRYEEIHDELDQYLNAAAMASLPFVRIIHGKGGGVLRRAVGEYLRKSPVVEKSEFGKTNEGGDGVTIVYLSS